MKVWKKGAPWFYEGPQNCIRILWRSEQFASGFYEGLSNFHQDFMKVWAISIRIARRSEKCIRILMVVWNKCSMIVWRSEKSASAVYEGPNSASGFAEGLKALHQDCTKVWTLCIRIVWRPESCASGLYEGLGKTHQEFMKVWLGTRMHSRVHTMHHSQNPAFAPTNPGICVLRGK